MCRELDILSRSITDLAAGFDADSLTPGEAGRVVAVCSRMEASVASVKALAAARAAEGSSWKHEGYRSPADQLAHRAGMSPGAARRALDTGRRMSGQPEVARAALAGELTPEQAAAVSDGAAADPGRARQLIEQARRSTVTELNQEVARVKAGRTDLEARRREIHAKRTLRRWTDREGAVHAHMYGNPEGAVAVWQTLDPLRRRLIMARRGRGEHESLDALDYDALVTLARLACGQDAEIGFDELLDMGLFPQARAARALPAAPPGDTLQPADPDPGPPQRAKKLAGGPAKVIVRVDLDALLRGWPAEGELCEMDGCGPVAVSLIRELMARGANLIALALTRAERVEAVYHHGRRPTAAQRTALELIYPTCAAAGCHARSGLEMDHREDWARTHFTALDLLDRLCPHHHKLKTHKGWGLVAGTGKRPFVPPDDPRHPGRAGPGTDAGTGPPVTDLQPYPAPRPGSMLDVDRLTGEDYR